MKASRLICGVLLLVLGVSSLCMFSWGQDLPSILNPTQPDKTQFQFYVDKVNPSPSNNPKGANSEGYRAIGQLVIYTAAFGSKTQTNEFGQEVIVSGNEIIALNPANSAIPTDGFVISGHGQTGQWLQRVLKQGMSAYFSPTTLQVWVEITPKMYLLSAKKALDLAEQQPSISTESKAKLAEAQQCFENLQDMALKGLSPQLSKLSTQCEAAANEAYFLTVASVPNEFRGIWVRPSEQTPEQIEQSLNLLQKAHINQIFIETYALGQTIYPSEVMQKYGLPKQQLAFEGWDPLSVWVDKAHQRGIKIHAWVQTFYAGDKQISQEAYGPILQKYPQWANQHYAARNATKPYPSFVEPDHYFLDPANPEARHFLDQLFMEMSSHYALDGLNLDYIRYPASYPPSYSKYLSSNWGYSQTSRQLFSTQLKVQLKADLQREYPRLKAQLGPKKAAHLIALQQKRLVGISTDPITFTPSHPFWPQWITWRQNQVDSFVQAIAHNAHQHKPEILISAVVFDNPDDPHHLIKLQNWPEWVEKGYVEALTPIGLGNTSKEVFQTAQRFQRTTHGKVPVYAGIFGMYNNASPAELLSQIDAVHRAGLPGVILFDRSKLTENYNQALILGAFRE